MQVSESELAVRFRRRARRALLAGLAALNAPAPALRRAQAKLAPEAVHEALSVAVLRFVVLRLAQGRGLFQRAADFEQGRLFAPMSGLLDVQPSWLDGHVVWQFPEPLRDAADAFQAELGQGLDADGVTFGDCPVELVGNLYELLLAESVTRTPGGQWQLGSGTKRKQTGTFFTPRALTEVVVRRSFEPFERHRPALLEPGALRACDPTVGGGAFLVEVARQLAERNTATLEQRRAIATQSLFGVDINPIAVAVAEAALCLFVADPDLPLQEAGRNLRVADALLGAPYARATPPKSGPSSRLERGAACDFPAQFPEVFARGGFDLVIGNPPWVAYAGRAAQPLPAERKAYFAAHFSTLKGYPTLHGLFVERALHLAPRGTVALVVPSPIADLQGYRAVRRAVRASHAPCEPMLEFGQDAFESVTQPCFALIAEQRASGARADRDSEPSDEPFRLAERQRAGATAAEVAAPASLAALASLPSFPRELFGEMGFQTTSTVTQQLLKRAAEPDARHHYPLLEGRDVHPFSQGRPRLFLAPDRAALHEARCRLREREDYGRVKFVIRQTARYPIAARHQGLPFRNSLLAGFEVDGLSPDLVVGLLNSSLYRALHLARQRDARQATFPQIKIAHLRTLPAPPPDSAQRERIARLSAEMSTTGLDDARTALLDAAVFTIFAIDSPSVHDIVEFLRARGGPRR